MKSLLRIARTSLLLWFGAAFLAGGLVCLSMGIQWAAQQQLYRNDGRTVDAVVLSKSIKPASRQENSSTRYEITYRFTTENGMEIHGTDAVGVELWESLAQGGRVRITYLSGDPQSNRVENSGDMGSSLAAIVLGSVFGVVGGFFFVRSGTKVLRQWSILRAGDAVQGTITAIAPTNVEVNNVRQWEVRYQYRDHLSRIHEGTSDALAPGEAGTLAVGDKVNIRFDRERSEESVLESPELPLKEQGSQNSSSSETHPSFWTQLGGFARMLALVFVVIILGEVLTQLTGFDRIIARHEDVLLPATFATAALGFMLFMGGILYRIFGGEGEPMSHADVEDLSRRSAFHTRPSFARASAYRFKGKSAGSSFHDSFSIKEAKAAWNQRAWRNSLRWRGNFVIMAGVLLLTVGLFGVFIVIGTGGIKLLCAGAILYALVRTIVAFARE